MRVHAAAAVAALYPQVVAGAPPVPLVVPAGPLASAVAAIGMQADVSIGIAEGDLASMRVRALTGRFTVADALHRLLRGTGAEARRITDGTFRIVRVAPEPTQRARPPGPAIAAADIVVTASKRSTPLASYAGSATVVDLQPLRGGAVLRGTDALIERQPILASTHLGPGRNKVFIRGIADSSFNGPSQSTVGEYLGEVRLNYNAPDPDLALYDIAAVEVLEGPQGTLYGAGSLGGILRLVPNDPDVRQASAVFSAGGALVGAGGPDHDMALVGNLPLVRDRLALRAVIYEGLNGGYIDDAARRLRNVNRTRIYGGRATLRFQPGPNWTIDLGGTVQNIASRDGQYALKGLAPLTRASVLAQPFDNDYALASLVVRHQSGALALVSATSAVFHDVGSIYDASASAAAPSRFVEDNSIRLFSNETRLARTTPGGGGWVIGAQLLHSRSRISRTLGAPGSEPNIAGTLNTVDEAALYGEATVPLGYNLYATGGGRLAYDRLVGQVVDQPVSSGEFRRSEVAVLPSAGLLWRPDQRTALYARFQRGYRPGGLSVQSSETQRFGSDSISTWEVGVRLNAPDDIVSATAAASFARWSDIQADLVNAAGLPYTTNVGNGRVLALEARLRWRPASRLLLEAAALGSDSRLHHPAPAFTGERDATLPNIADLVARLDARYEVRALGRRIELSAAANYVGRSRLGVGPTLDLRQGGYLNLSAGVAAPFGRLSVRLDGTNLAGVRGNVFAFGNPFGVGRGDQVTPLRPRTVRVGLSVAF